MKDSKINFRLQTALCKNLGKLSGGGDKVMVMNKQKSPPEGRLSIASFYYL